jgi:hypothetical protein
MEDWRINPGHGLSPSTASLKMWKASARGNPQVLFSILIVGIAFE